MWFVELAWSGILPTYLDYMSCCIGIPDTLCHAGLQHLLQLLIHNILLISHLRLCTPSSLQPTKVRIISRAGSVLYIPPRIPQRIITAADAAARETRPLTPLIVWNHLLTWRLLWQNPLHSQRLRCLRRQRLVQTTVPALWCPRSVVQRETMLAPLSKRPPCLRYHLPSSTMIATPPLGICDKEN